MKISILLEALTGRFETDTQRASKTFQREMRKMERRGAQFGRRLALVLSPVALTAIVKKSVEFADSIGKTADKLGIGVEELQAYRFAASQAGIQTQTFDMAMQRFTRRAAEAKEGTGEARNAIKELNLQLTDGEGKLRRTDHLLRDIADAFAEGVDPADRLRIAQKLFDSEGVVMVNLLREGADGLDRLTQKARDAGAVLGEDLVRDAEMAANKMDEFQKIMATRIAGTVIENTDSIIALTEALITFVGVIGRATQGWDLWLARQGVGVDTLDEIRARGDELLADRQRLETELAQYDQSRRLDPFDGYRNALVKQIDEIKAEQLELQVQAKALITAAQGPLEPPDPIARRDPGDVPGLLNIGPDPKLVKKRADEIASIIDGLRNQVRTFGMADESALIQLTDLGADQESINAASDYLGKLIAMRQEVEKRTEAEQDRAASEGEYLALVESLRTPLEDHVAMIERIAELYDAGIIPSAEEYVDVINRVTKAYDEANKKTEELDEFSRQAARNFQDLLGDFLFDPMSEGFDGLVDDFGEMLARMAAQAAAAAIFKKLFGIEGGEGGALSTLFGGSGGGFGSFISSIFGGGRASGGPVTAGIPYLVGERGPEMVIPNASGTVISNQDLAALGGNQNITNNFIMEANEDRRTPSQLAIELEMRQRRAASRNF